MWFCVKCDGRLLTTSRCQTPFLSAKTKWVCILPAAITERKEKRLTKEKVNTPYDDAFRTILVKCPSLVIPLVNEAFHEEYGLREKVSVFHNEFFIGNEHQKERITDSHISICNKRYHAECQSSTDGTITMRIFEYDAQIAAENAETEDGRTTFTFPYSAILYLRCPADTPGTMQVAFRVPNNCVSYVIPIIKVPEYTADEILEKELYFLIPFHIFAYEKGLERINDDPEKLEYLLQVYRRFADVLQQKVKEGRLTEYERQVIRDMTVKVACSLAAKWSNVTKGVGKIMGGEILELEVDKILNRGIITTLVSLVRDGLLDPAEGAKRANMTREEFAQKMNEI